MYTTKLDRADVEKPTLRQNEEKPTSPKGAASHYLDLEEEVSQGKKHSRQAAPTASPNQISDNLNKLRLWLRFLSWIVVTEVAKELVHFLMIAIS